MFRVPSIVLRGHASRGTALVQSLLSLKVHPFSFTSLCIPPAPPPHHRPESKGSKQGRGLSSRPPRSTMPSLADAYTSAFRKKSNAMTVVTR